MKSKRNPVLCPNGQPFSLPLSLAVSLADLPPTDTTRWVRRRKAMLVAAVDGGLLSLEEACERYRLTVEEFMTWRADYADRGHEALRIRRLQQQRLRRILSHACERMGASA